MVHTGGTILQVIHSIVSLRGTVNTAVGCWFLRDRFCIVCTGVLVRSSAKYIHLLLSVRI